MSRVSVRPDKPGTALRGRYLVKNRPVNLFLRCVDSFLAVLRSFARKPAIPVAPRRILIANPAHLGDVLIASAVLPSLRAAYPNAQFGFLIGSWAKPVISAHPDITWFHYVDHWKINRNALPIWKKLRHYWRGRQQALHDIRTVGYDLAIDLYYYFPNFIPLLWQSGIPLRIGYVSGGFGPLLTHALKWEERDCHVMDYQKDLLRILGLREEVLDKVWPFLPRQDEAFWKTLADRLGLQAQQYIVLHMGTGSPLREWPRESWRKLAKKLQESDLLLVFTGMGSREQLNIEFVVNGLDNYLNLCDQLRWSEYVEVIAHARIVLGVESLSGHLAAAAQVPNIFIKSGITHPLHWVPFNSKGQEITFEMPCSPCYISTGCTDMECVTGIKPAAIYSVCLEKLR
jgi:ADP-heptose:LPS heptosyltransferase